MSISIFDTRNMTGVVNRVKVVEPFLYNMLYSGRSEFHVNGTVDFEISTNEPKLSQFVRDFGPALQVKKGSKEFKTIRIPRTYEEKVFEIQELLNYQSLTKPVYGNTVADISKMANDYVMKEVLELKNRVYRLKEKMVCDGLALGGISVAQDNVAFNIDFGFDSTPATGNILTNESADKWTASTANIKSQFDSWARYIMVNTGNNPDTIILTPTAASAFLANAKVLAALDTRNYQVGTLNLTGKMAKTGRRLGNIYGYEIYEYNQMYMDNNGVMQPFIPEGKAIMFDSTNTGFRDHYAPAARIINGNVQLFQDPFYLESETNREKTALSWKLDQKSLPTIHEPKAVVSVIVV